MKAALPPVGRLKETKIIYGPLFARYRESVNPRAYLRWLFERLPTATNRTVHKLTPAAYAALHCDPAPAIAA